MLSRPETKDDFTLFLLDEFLNIKIPPELEMQLFTLCRSKGIQLIYASQYLPNNDKDKRIQTLLSSRSLFVIFKVSDMETLNILDRSFGEQEFITSSTKLGMSHAFLKTIGGGPGIATLIATFGAGIGTAGW